MFLFLFLTSFFFCDNQKPRPVGTFLSLPDSFLPTFILFPACCSDPQHRSLTVSPASHPHHRNLTVSPASHGIWGWGVGGWEGTVAKCNSPRCRGRLAIETGATVHSLTPRPKSNRRRSRARNHTQVTEGEGRFCSGLNDLAVSTL